MPTDEEQAKRELIQAEWAHTDAVAAAKAAAQANPHDKEIQAEFRRVKLEHREFRQHWRTVRRYVQDLAIAGDEAALSALRDELGDGGAFAGPATVGLTANVEDPQATTEG